MEQTKQKWTPEPWRSSHRVDYFPSCEGYEIIHGANWYAFAKSKADANRIVDCINSLAGIEDPAKVVAEAKKTATRLEMAENLIKTDGVIEKQRDALLKAAREVITFPFDQKPREDLKDAVAKAPN